MRNLLSAFLLLAAPLAAHAAPDDVPLTPGQFEAYVMGQTLTYSAASGPYGAEEYLHDHRVRWSYLDGTCQDGRWYAAGDEICFVYELIPDPQCWRFYLRGERLMARFENDPGATELYETSHRSEPLICPGPRVGT